MCDFVCLREREVCPPSIRAAYDHQHTHTHAASPLHSPHVFQRPALHKTGMMAVPKQRWSAKQVQQTKLLRSPRNFSSPGRQKSTQASCRYRAAQSLQQTIPGNIGFGFKKCPFLSFEVSFHRLFSTRPFWSLREVSALAGAVGAFALPGPLLCGRAGWRQRHDADLPLGAGGRADGHPR